MNIENNQNDNYMKKNHILTYNKFMELIDKISIPYFFNLKRSNGVLDNNWILVYKSSNNDFIYWYQGKWLVYLTKKINNIDYYKYVSINDLNKFNIINFDEIIKKINNFMF